MAKVKKNVTVEGIKWEFVYDNTKRTLDVTKVTLKGDRINQVFNLDTDRLPASVIPAFTQAFPKLSKTIEVHRKEEVPVIKVIKKDGSEEELVPLPRAVTNNSFLRPNKDLKNTVADPDVTNIKVGRVLFPTLKPQIREAVKLTYGEAPVVSEGGKHEVESVRVTNRNYKDEITGFEFRIRETGSGKGWTRRFTSNKVVLNALKDYLEPGKIFNLASLGSLEAGSNQVSVINFGDGELVDVPVYAWRINKAIEDFNRTKDENQFRMNLVQARYDIIPAFENELELSVFNAHSNLRATNVVLDSNVIPMTVIGLGQTYAQFLVRAINRIRLANDLEIGPVSIYDLTGLDVNVACRFPIDSPGNVLTDFKLMVLADKVNALYVHPEVLLGANGDADGDTFTMELLRSAILALTHKKTRTFELTADRKLEELKDVKVVREATRKVDRVEDGLVYTSTNIDETIVEVEDKPDMELLRAMPEIKMFRAPVSKEGDLLSVYDFEGVAPRNPIDVMVGQMSKAFTGLVTNGMNAMSVLARCLGDTSINRNRVLRALGVDRITQDMLSNAMAYKKAVTIAIKKNLIVVDEVIMDFWKDFEKGPEAVFLPQLDMIMEFLTVDKVYLIESVMNRMNEKHPGFNANALNALKQMGGGFAPQKAIQQWPIAASIIGTPNMDAIIRGINASGVDTVLKYLDGTLIEEKNPIIEEGVAVETQERIIRPYVFPRTDFDSKSFNNPWNSIQQYVNRIMKKQVLKCEVIGFDVKLSINGKIVIIPNYQFEINRTGTCILVRRGKSLRVSKLIACVRNLNAGRMINNGMNPEEAVDDIVFETILDRFAQRMLDITRNYVDNKIAEYELQDISTKTLAKLFDDHTDIVNSPDFEVFLHDHRVAIELPSVSPRYIIETAKAITPLMQDMINPLTGHPLHLHFGLSSKNKPGESAGIFWPTLIREGNGGVKKEFKATSAPIDMVAHLLGGVAGVNEARLWKEAWTTRFSLKFVEPGTHRMFNGWEAALPELHERSKDILVLIANMEGHLSYSGITSDKGLITKYGMSILETVPHASKTTGLRKEQLIHECEKITGIEGEDSLKAVTQEGYTIVEAYRPLDVDAFTGEGISEKTYTLIEPLDDDEPTWKKLYFSGYKGIFVAIDQDFEVEVGDGRREKVAAIMDSRTFHSKKMHAEYIAGALALYGKERFLTRPVFGEGSLHEDLCMKLMEENNETGTRKVYSESGEVLGEGFAALFRTYVLKADPDYMSIRDGAFKATVDIMGLTGRSYDINPKVKSILGRLAAPIA